MNFRLRLLIPVLFIFAAGCGTGMLNNEALDLENDFQLAGVENKYSIKVPNYMSVSTELSEEASVQYESLIQDCYLMVIDENTSEFVSIFTELGMIDTSQTTLQNYFSYQKESIANTMDVTTESEVRSLKINGNQTLMVQIDGGVPEVKADVTYLLAVIEGESTIYSVLYWTTKENSKKALVHFEQSIHSFQDL